MQYILYVYVHSKLTWKPFLNFLSRRILKGEINHTNLRQEKIHYITEGGSIFLDLSFPFICKPKRLLNWFTNEFPSVTDINWKSEFSYGIT